MFDFATRIKDVKDVAALWKWSKITRYGKKFSADNVNPIFEYCNVSTSEENEAKECLASKGQTRSAYGTKGKLNSFPAFVEYVASNWISIQK